MHPKASHRQHQRAPALRAPLSHRHRNWLYTASALLLLSGAAWLLAHFVLRSADLVAQGAPHPAEAWLLRIHGAAQLGFLIAFGALLPEHVLYGWRQRLNHASGALMISVVILLTVSGYGLYYASGDTFRQWISVLHWAIGLLAAAILIWHILRGRSLRRDRSRRLH